MAVYCIVPAAGESSRFPFNKLLYKYSNKPLIVQTIENIAESSIFDKIIIVLGYRADLVVEVLKSVEKYADLLDLVINPDFRKGMSTSIKTGVKYIVEKYSSIDIICVNPGDVAWIHPGVYVNVYARFIEHLEDFYVAVATYNGRRGHPIFFSRAILQDLLSITEEKMGLREITFKYRDRTLLVETGYPGVILDLDTVLDLLRIKQLVYK